MNICHWLSAIEKEEKFASNDKQSENLSLSKLGQMSLDECVRVFVILTCPIKKGRDLSTSVIGFYPREVRIKETQDSFMQVPCSRKERKNKVSALTNTQYFPA